MVGPMIATIHRQRGRRWPASDSPWPIHALLIVLLLLAALIPAPASAKPVSIDSAPLQASYLINFVRYTEWPDDQFASEDSPFVISVAGPNWLLAAIREAARATGTLQQRPVVVRPLRLLRRSRVVPAEKVRELRASHVLFIHASHASLQPQLLDTVRRRPVLTVGSSDGFVEAGGMLGLVEAAEGLAFEANPNVIRQSGLQVSSKVLRMARDSEARR
jgi:hypothetical protein